MSPLLARVVAAVGAGVFGQVVNVVIQIASLPLFLLRWDLSTYGTWLMLSAMPAYLSMADIGMVSTAGNRMTMEMGRGNLSSAHQIFHSATAFMMLTCTAFSLVFMPLVLWAPIPGVSSWDERLALAALVMGVLLTLGGGLADALFRATERYALGASLSTTVRLAEWAGWILGLFIWRSFSAVAFSGLTARAVGVCLTILWSRHESSGLEWGIRRAQIGEIRAMVRPAIAFMLFPLANAISFQGATLLVGQLFGPAVVALFNAYRTIARVAVQVTGTFGHALWAEFSRLFGEGGGKSLRHVYHRSSWVGTGVSVGLSAVLYWLSPFLLRIWTHGVIDFEPALMSLLLAYAAVCGSWHVPRVLLMATNQHVDLAMWVLLAAIVAFCLSYLLGSAWGISGVGMGMLLSEMLIAGLCVWLARRMVGAK